LTTPKDDELVATPYRHDGRDAAEAFFMQGMGEALTAMRKAATDSEPLAIYYAFKQSEVAADGITLAGWASFVLAVVEAGLVVDGTWPVRTELANRMIGKNANALASSIVLVCRKRSADATTITRADFIRLLRRELPDAKLDPQFGYAEGFDEATGKYHKLIWAKNPPQFAAPRAK
jgi:putative DNA methylase